MPELAIAVAASGKNRRSEIMKLVAFLGRYGHQRAKDVLSMPITDAMLLANKVGELIREENDAHRSAMETDG